MTLFKVMVLAGASLLVITFQMRITPNEMEEIEGMVKHMNVKDPKKLAEAKPPSKGGGKGTANGKFPGKGRGKGSANGKPSNNGRGLGTTLEKQLKAAEAKAKAAESNRETIALRAEVREAAKPAAKVLGSDVRRQLRLVVGGLMGSGKSTLCRMLAHLLQGVWVNQDEFSHKGKRAKDAFLAEIKRVSEDKKVPVLIVDKINTMRQHRRGILDAMKHGVPGDTVFIQIAHPEDPDGSLHRTMKTCLSRIRSRGEGHRTLMGSDPKLEKILRMTASGVEALDKSELSCFGGRFTVDMTLSPQQSVMQLLADLDNQGFLGRFHMEELLMRIEEAFKVTQDAEKELAKSKQPANGQPANEKKPPPPVWIYVLEFDSGAQEAIRSAWQKHASQAPDLNLQKAFHVTLLYLGGRSDKQLAARQSTLHSAVEAGKLRQELTKLEGREMEVQLSSIVWDYKIAAAEITGEGLTSICANVHSHATLALKKGTAPVMSNELLARRDANLDLDGFLKEWLTQLGLEHYAPLAAAWCHKSGIKTADAVAARATELASALEQDEDQRARIKKVLAQAAQGEVHSSIFQNPIKLKARVHGRLLGE